MNVEQHYLIQDQSPEGRMEMEDTHSDLAGS